ncbi:hypothetical protein D9M69_719030 [compost metagenome]
MAFPSPEVPPSRSFGGAGLAQAAPIPAAVSTAAKASSMPKKGMTPAAISDSAVCSGMFSPRLATMPARAPVALAASITASQVVTQSVASQRSWRGKSSTMRLSA